MALLTDPIFYYGIEVTSDNKYIDFDEGGPEINAELTPDSYSLSELGDHVCEVLSAAGNQVYTCSIDRDTRIITISATSSFDILWSSGTNTARNASSLLGFANTDTGSVTSVAGISAIGLTFEPQFLLQDYLDKADNQELIDPSVNISANGTVETIKFGDQQFYEMSFKFINNGVLSGSPFTYNATGKDEFNSFMQDIINKNTFEYMPNKNNRSTFDKVILESLRGNRKGTGYRLKELVGKGLPGVYELNNVRLRVKT